MTKQLTGRIRHRINWRGKLILQVEFTIEHTRDLNGSGYYDEWTCSYWRDAKVTDLRSSLAVSNTVEALR